LAAFDRQTGINTRFKPFEGLPGPKMTVYGEFWGGPETSKKGSAGKSEKPDRFGGQVDPFRFLKLTQNFKNFQPL
jgi:hypothetical protein